MQSWLIGKNPTAFRKPKRKVLGSVMIRRHLPRKERFEVLAKWKSFCETNLNWVELLSLEEVVPVLFQKFLDELSPDETQRQHRLIQQLRSKMHICHEVMLTVLGKCQYKEIKTKRFTDLYILREYQRMHILEGAEEDAVIK